MAHISPIQRVSEPFRDILSVFVPIAGSASGVFVAIDEDVLGPVVAVTHVSAGIWTIEVTNNFPLYSNLVVTSGVTREFTAGHAAVMATLTTSKVLQIVTSVIQQPGSVISDEDMDAWVKIEKSVF